MALSKSDIARRIAMELKNGDYVSLGVGLPTLVANHIPDDKKVILHSDNGILGVGPSPLEGCEDENVINVSKEMVSTLNGASFFDSSISFGMIRRGCINVAVLGAMEVAENGDIANWKIPGKIVKGMGGVMDVLASVPYIIVGMIHKDKEGHSKLLRRCTLPLSGSGCVKLIVTDLAVLSVVDGGFKLLERAPGVSIEEIISATEGKLICDGMVPEIAFVGQYCK